MISSNLMIRKCKAIGMSLLSLLFIDYLAPMAVHSGYISYDASDFKVNAVCDINIEGKYRFSGPCHYRETTGFVSDRKLRLACNTMTNCTYEWVDQTGYNFEITHLIAGFVNITWNNGGVYGGIEIGTFRKSGNCYRRKQSSICLYLN